MTDSGATTASPGRLRTWFHNSSRLLSIFWRHRSFFVSMMRAAKRKREIQKVDLKNDDGIAVRPPADVNLYLTDDCNLRCRMCGRYRVGGRFAGKQGAPELCTQLDLEVYAGLFEQLRDRPTFYYISGGEPLLYRHGTANLIRYAKRFRSTVALNTNATLLEEQADDLVDAGLDLIMVSLDGPRDVHDDIRGKGVFDKAAAGIRRLHSARRRLRRNNPVVSVLLTASPWNYEALDCLPRLADELDLEMAGINFLQFTDNERGAATAQIWRDEFGVEAAAWKGYVIDTGDIDIAACRSSYERLLAAGKRFLFYTMPPALEPASLGTFYGDLSETFGRTQCWKPWYRTYLRPNGNITTCEHYCDVTVGNILRQPLDEIWNGEAYRHFRRVLRENGMFPFCTRCTSGLYEL